MIELELFTDGACAGNPGKGGWAFLLIKDGAIIAKENGAEPFTTNNIMELLSIVKALEFISKNFPNEPVRLFSDSAYCINGLSSWVYNWEKNGWITANKTPVKNKELWQAILNYTRKLDVSFEKVKGHANNTYNQIVDRLAVEARQNGH